ncbi:MAG: pilin [Candidatus Peregrinibacteria bacterium]
MKKLFYTLLGSLLLLPLTVSEALGLTLDDFQHEVYRPDNLPAGRATDASVEAKVVDIFNFATNLILYASGAVAVLLLIIGGIRYIVSFGNQEQTDAAKKTIKFAVIGLVVVILAYAIVTNIIDIIYRSTV